MMDELRVLAVDIGNTTTELGWTNATGGFERVFLVANPEEGLRENSADWIRELLSIPGFADLFLDRIVISSVRPGLTALVKTALAAIFTTPIEVFGPLSSHGLAIHYLDPSTLGGDRIAGALGARAELPGENILLVDLGTATTFSAISENGDFLGGLIVPGYRTAFEAIRARAELLRALPECRSPLGPPSHLAKSTEDAVWNGAYWLQHAALVGIGGGLGREAFGGDPYVVVLTGGNAKVFKRNLPESFRYFDRLVLKGLVAYQRSKYAPYIDEIENSPGHRYRSRSQLRGVDLDRSYFDRSG